MTNLSPYSIHEPVVPYQYHIKGPLQLISNQKILQQICVHCYLLWKTFYSGAISSIPSPHQCPQGFIYHCPWVPSVWSSLFELSMEFSPKLLARVAEDSYIPCSPLLVRCSLTTMHALAHWHSYIPITLGGKDQVGSPRDNCPGVLYCPCVL